MNWFSEILELLAISKQAVDVQYLWEKNKIKKPWVVFIYQILFLGRLTLYTLALLLFDLTETSFPPLDYIHNNDISPYNLSE